MNFDAQPDHIAERLRKLSDDFQRMGSPDYLRSLDPEAILTNWMLSPDIVFSLRGEVSGHPHLRAGPIETSQLFFIDQKLGLARTLSRWYRLGAPLDLGLNRPRQ